MTQPKQDQIQLKYLEGGTFSGRARVILKAMGGEWTIKEIAHPENPNLVGYVLYNPRVQTQFALLISDVEKLKAVGLIEYIQFH